MIDFPKFNEIQKAQKDQKARIYNAFAKTEDENSATLITKSDFEANYPLAQYEVYSLGAVQKFREDLMKATDYTDEQFQAATKDLKSFVVQNAAEKVILFARKKVAGE